MRGPLFFLCCFMKGGLFTPKIFLTYQQQINKLKNEKFMVISDEKYANEAIPNMPLHRKLQIPCQNGQFQMGKSDLFAVVIALRYLIDNADFKQFKAKLSLLMKKVLKNCPHLTEDKLLKEMGFPKNWTKISYYKKNTSSNK